MNKQKLSEVMNSLSNLYSSIQESNDLKSNGLKDSILESYQKAHRMYGIVIAKERDEELKKLQRTMPYSGHVQMKDNVAS